ncbi:MAG: bifunctional demethylmenaquinone methyltransferase/2-methoxy-6-polyprenyl-1,4-benzoquinol methylase UbiE [Paludibacteraceae bacterium]|nr:bifunctional demethylmenaquinone methyltransferase/2-methoxy-6-polyprenyl-1,4-benzoquinol methylase UbiE [Paludibacteraceae bacterium]
MNEKQNIGSLFDRIAKTYDVLNHGLSLNIDRRWRRKAVASMQPARRVLDVAIGTADLTIEMLRQGKAVQVTGIDLSTEMMAIGEEKIIREKAKGRMDESAEVEFVYGNAQEMPYEEGSFDAVTCAFGCRNFADLDAGLREMHRVLRPGGQVVILEFSYPGNPIIRKMYDIYFSYILPFIGRIVSHDKTAYTYLNRSVKGFVWGEAFVQHLHDIGFVHEHFTPLTLGIATVYMARKKG